MVANEVAVGIGALGDSEADVLVASQRETSLFGDFYRSHAVEVLTYFSQRTACPETAADLTAETFAEAFSSRWRFRNTGAPPQAWLFKIARRQLSRYIRREVVSNKYRHKLGITERIGPTVIDVDRIHQLVDTDPLRSELMESLWELPEGQRRAIELRVGHDLPYEQVAIRLGCTEQAARARVSRGLVVLRERLAGTEGRGQGAL